MLNEYLILDIDTIEDLVQLMRSPKLVETPEPNTFLAVLDEQLNLTE